MPCCKEEIGLVDLCVELLQALRGHSLATAESCTGGSIGSIITAIPGSSAVYKGGVICYSNWVKEQILSVDPDLLKQYGPVSLPVAKQMVTGVKNLLQADATISVTGLAGPGGDEYGNAVGTVFIGTGFQEKTEVREYHFSGHRESVRSQAVQAALRQLLDMIRRQS